jgi:hypothetical protein
MALAWQRCIRTRDTDCPLRLGGQSVGAVRDDRSGFLRASLSRPDPCRREGMREGWLLRQRKGPGAPARQRWSPRSTRAHGQPRIAAELSPDPLSRSSVPQRGARGDELPACQWGRPQVSVHMRVNHVPRRANSFNADCGAVPARVARAGEGRCVPASDRNWRCPQPSPRLRQPGGRAWPASIRSHVRRVAHSLDTCTDVRPVMTCEDPHPEIGSTQAACPDWGPSSK